MKNVNERKCRKREGKEKINEDQTERETDLNKRDRGQKGKTR